MNPYVTLREIPAMTGLTLWTVYNHRGTGRLPQEDEMIGTTPVWKPTTIVKWNDERNKR